MKLDRMLQLVDNLVLYEKDFVTLNILMNNLEPKLFVKIMEEILEENLFFSDFERIFTDDYARQLENNFEKQQQLQIEIQRLVSFREEITGDTFSNNPATTMIGIPKPSEQDQYMPFYEDITSEERETLIYHLFDYQENDSLLVRAAKMKVRESVYSSDFNQNDLLLFLDSYIIPIDFEHQTLNKDDINFILENNLTEDEVKKMKAFAIFLKRKEYDFGGV